MTPISTYAVAPDGSRFELQIVRFTRTRLFLKDQGMWSRATGRPMPRCGIEWVIPGGELLRLNEMLETTPNGRLER